MDVASTGPFSVGSLLWQRPGGRVLTVVAKATFTLVPGESVLADEQDPVCLEDSHLEDDPARSLQAPSDLVPFKARADVVLVGYAFAPRGEAVRSLVVRLIVGEIDRSIEVVGDRAWALDGSLREGGRFVRMALRYERAGGGPDTANPIGMSESAPPDTYGMTPLPNLQPVGFHASRRGEVILPVGFGPISPSWPARRERLGRIPPRDRWDGPLPPDLDPAYFNCAPRDQQAERLRDNERLVLENLHPQHARLVTSLPGLHPRAFADRGDGQPQEVPLVCDTLWIDTGRGLCTLTWRGYVENPPGDGRVVVLAEGAGRTIDWNELRSPAPKAPARPSQPRTSQAPSPPAQPGQAPSLSRPSQAPPPPVQPGQAPSLSRPSQAPPPLAQPGQASPAAANRPRSPKTLPIMTSSAKEVGLPFQSTGSGAKEVGLPFQSTGSLTKEMGLPFQPSTGASPGAGRLAAMVPAPKRAAEVPEGWRAGGAPMLDPLWYDAGRVARVRVRWGEIVAALDAEPEDPRGEDAETARGRRHVFGAMSKGALLESAAVGQAAGEAAGRDGRFTPPLVLVGGELRFSFDEVETLRATITVIKMLAGHDAKLRETIEGMRELLETPYLEVGGSVVEKLTQQLAEGFRETSRGLPAGYVDGLVERSLIEQRRYAIRQVLGGGFLRGMLGSAREEGAMVVYVPAEVARLLPMMASVRVRIIAEVHPQQDPVDVGPGALRAVAVGRVLSS